MIDIGNIIDSLVADCDKGLIPDTAEDTKVVVSKEGQIGEVLAGLMVEKFRRFGDSLMVFNGMYYEKIKPDDIRRLVQGFLTKLGQPRPFLQGFRDHHLLPRHDLSGHRWPCQRRLRLGCHFGRLHLHRR